MDWMDLTFHHNTVRAWITALGTVVAAAIVLALIKRLVRPKLVEFRSRAVEITGLVLELLDGTRTILLAIVVAYLAIRPLEIDPKLDQIVRSAAVIAILIQLGLWAVDILQHGLDRYRDERLATDASAVTTMAAIGFVTKIALWAVITLVALDNLGIDVTALIAGLGVGGVAIALATQNILGDLFASLSIVIDKPFVIGDTINVGGDFVGTVERIGLKTTRIRSLSGEQIIFSNGDLLSSRIRNVKRMAERRIVFSFGVVYQTSAEKVAAIPGMVREIIDGLENTRFDRAHFKAFGDSSLDFEVVYYLTIPDYIVYMDTQQAINLTLFRRFEDEGIDFAYPTRTLYLEKAEELKR